MENVELKAWAQNGVLHVSGLTTGKPWSIYNLYGQLIYNGIADGNEVVFISFNQAEKLLKRFIKNIAGTGQETPCPPQYLFCRGKGQGIPAFAGMTND